MILINGLGDSVTVTILVCGGETGDLFLLKKLSLLLNLCPHPHMWAWAAGSIKKLSWVQMAEMRFLCRVAWLAVCIRVRSLIIWEHCRIERRQLKWFGHHVRMPLGQLFGRAVLDNSNWTETQWARIRTYLRYCISQFAWENSGNPLRRMWYQWPWE